MSNISKDIQYAGSDTRPLMLDRTDFESWQQRIRLYCLGKDNGENIMKSITEGPFQMGTIRDTLAEGGEGALHLGPVRARVFVDLSAEQKDMYKADIRATNIILQAHLPQTINSELPQTQGTMLQFKMAKLLFRMFEVESKATNQRRPFQRNNARGVVGTGNVGGSGTIAREMSTTKLSGFPDYYPRDRDAAYNAHENWCLCQMRCFDLDVDEAPTTQTMFMANLTSKEAGQSYDSNIPSEVQDREYDSDCEDRPKPFYDEKNKVAIGYKNPLCLTRAKQVQSALYDGNEIVRTNHAPAVVHDSEDTLEIAEITRKRMLEKVKSPFCVEHKVKFAPPDYSKENYLAIFTPQRDLTPEQIFWSKDENDRKKAETSVPKPLSTPTVYPPNTPVKLVPRVLPTKSVTEEERGFEQTKQCYLTEVIPFFKILKEHFCMIQRLLFKEVKVMEGIFDQMSDEVDQNVVDKQCAEIERKNILIENENLIAKPKPFYDEKNKVAIGYKNPLCLTRAKQVQSALYDGNEIVRTNHAPAVVHDSEGTLEITEITRKRMLKKVKSPFCVEHMVKFAPPNYSKENYLAIFTPQRDLTPKQIFWSKDENNRKKAETSVPKPLSTPTVYPPNTPVKLVPRVLPTKSQVKINLYTLTQRFTEFDKTCKKRITPTSVTERERDDGSNVMTRMSEIERKNILIENENLIAKCFVMSKWFIKNLEHQIQKKDNVIKDLKVLVSNVNDRSCEPYNDKDFTDLLEQNERLRAEIEKFFKTKVLAPGVYAIDVESIPPRLKNNRSAYLVYINHLKESVEMVREIVEEARIVKPLDSALTFQPVNTRKLFTRNW
ncbi:hypothetical protein Tco_0180468 [Tanacetum coccineum]